ncbi:membrane-bound alpha-1,6- mannosyltransferase Initiation-specific [Rhizophlyctis rosea]|nr:membrane-bound alpha-1,6- mannosyltransferase Initiation-specific [Rhizophlyctis rosea]
MLKLQEITGPAVWTDAVREYLKQQGRDWKEFRGLKEAQQVGSLYLLTITGFSPDNKGMVAKGSDAPEACVKHLFWGSWKEGQEPFADG